MERFVSYFLFSRKTLQHLLDNARLYLLSGRSSLLFFFSFLFHLSIGNNFKIAIQFDSVSLSPKYGMPWQSTISFYCFGLDSPAATAMIDANDSDIFSFRFKFERIFQENLHFFSDYIHHHILSPLCIGNSRRRRGVSSSPVLGTTLLAVTLLPHPVWSSPEAALLS